MLSDEIRKIEKAFDGKFLGEVWRDGSTIRSENDLVRHEEIKAFLSEALTDISRATAEAGKVKNKVRDGVNGELNCPCGVCEANREIWNKAIDASNEKVEEFLNN